MTDRGRSDLINGLRIMLDYVDRNYESLSEKKAKEANKILESVWTVLDRRGK